MFGILRSTCDQSIVRRNHADDAESSAAIAAVYLILWQNLE